MHEPWVVTGCEGFRAVAADAPAGARVPVEVRVEVSDPFDAYRRARPDAGSTGRAVDGAYLATTGGQSGWGYFGVDPVDGLTVGPDAVAILPDVADGDGTGGDGATRPADASPTLAALAGLLDGETLVRGDCDVPYPCGAVGWLSYDVARELESLPEEAVDDRGLPHLECRVYDRLAAWEEPRGDGPVTLRVTACPRLPETAPDDPADASASVDAAYERGLERALDLARRTVDGDPTVGPPPVDADQATFESECGEAAFADRVRRVKDLVRAGDTFQTNVSQRLVAPAAVHPVAAFDALRRVNPAPYSALLEFPAADLVSASPELLLARDGDSLRTEPIAGTRPRGDTPEADERLEATLTGDEKERAEHAMLVDLERNDLGKVSEYGSVAVEEYRRVDRYSEVMHLVSSVVGRLRADATLADAVAAVFPGGTITGAPKPRTMEIIDEVEATRRGPYTGSVGLFGFDDRATLNIVIRTLVRMGDEYHLRVGAGIVHDSVPAAEYAETLDKARALVTAVDEALGDRAAFAVGTATDGGDGGRDDGGDGDD